MCTHDKFNMSTSFGTDLRREGRMVIIMDRRVVVYLL